MKSRKDFKLIDGDDQDEALLAEERRKAAAKILEHQQNEVRRNRHVSLSLLSCTLLKLLSEFERRDSVWFLVLYFLFPFFFFFASRNFSSQRTVNASSPSSILGQRETFFNCNDGPEDTASCIPLAINERNENPFGHIQTYREYKEALKLQRSVENSSIYRRAQLDTGAG